MDIAQSLEDSGVLAALEGKHARTARLFGATEVLSESLKRTRPVSWGEDYHRAEAARRSALPEAAFAAAWAEGRALSLNEAIARALEATDE